MVYLILGLVLFLSVHSVRIVAEGWRTQTLTRLGNGTYKSIFTILSLLGLGLIVWGFGVARETPNMLWMPPRGMRHAAALLTLIAFVLLAAAYVPRNAIKARVHHPMVLAVKTWALAHLLCNGSLAHVILFGSFLAWGVANFIAARKRDRALGTSYPAGTLVGTVSTVAVGLTAWAAVAFWLHGWLIGIRPLG
ncbi:MAG: NnrU family protein [Candidatus Saccharibacteria bacterium]|nr:NnrU family protein [Rhodoferax sp.]